LLEGAVDAPGQRGCGSVRADPAAGALISTLLLKSGNVLSTYDIDFDEGKTMSLRVVTKKAAVRVAHGASYASYEMYKRKTSIAQRNQVRDYVAGVVAANDKFSIATAFSDPWPDALSPIWNYCHDKKMAAFILAYIVLDYLQNEDKTAWLCTKTNIQERDFDSNFYWRDRHQPL
jgi:hypothetical protein